MADSTPSRDDTLRDLILGGVAVAGIRLGIVGIVGLVAEAIRPRDRVREVIQELRRDPILPRLRPIPRIMACVDPEGQTALEALASPEDPRVQVEKFQGVCERAAVREKEGVTPSGHTGDLVAGLRCVIDYEERRKGGPIHL